MSREEKKTVIGANRRDGGYTIARRHTPGNAFREQQTAVHVVVSTRLHAAAAYARVKTAGQHRSPPNRRIVVMTSPAGKPATIAQKARRKISLPWFRQGSAAPPHAALSRQHTIDTPSSFQARLLRRQPSLTQVLSCPRHLCQSCPRETSLSFIRDDFVLSPRVVRSNHFFFIDTCLLEKENISLNYRCENLF